MLQVAFYLFSSTKQFNLFLFPHVRGLHQIKIDSNEIQRLCNSCRSIFNLVIMSTIINKWSSCEWQQNDDYSVVVVVDDDNNSDGNDPRQWHKRQFQYTLHISVFVAGLNSIIRQFQRLLRSSPKTKQKKKTLRIGCFRYVELFYRCCLFDSL